MTAPEVQVIRFWFKVPAPEKMRELSTLMTAVFAMVNQIATYSLPPERLKQAEQVGTALATQYSPA